MNQASSRDWYVCVAMCGSRHTYELARTVYVWLHMCESCMRICVARLTRVKSYLWVTPHVWTCSYSVCVAHSVAPKIYVHVLGAYSHSVLVRHVTYEWKGESCHTCVWVISRIGVSRATNMNACTSYIIYECMYFIYECHIWMHVPHIYHKIYECMYFICMQSQRLSASRHTKGWMGESCHTCEIIMSRIWMSHTTHVEASGGYMRAYYFIMSRCSVSQCVAVCCSVLQCVAVCCSVLQCVAVCCSVLQCVAVCCNCNYFLMSHVRMNEWVVLHLWKSHMTHMNASCHTCECVMSYMWMRRRHVTIVNASSSDYYQNYFDH